MHENLMAGIAAADAASPELDAALWRVAAGPNATITAGRIPSYSGAPDARLTDAAIVESGPTNGRWRVRLAGQAEASEAATEALALRLAELRALVGED